MTISTQPNTWFTIQGSADYLGVHKNTIQNWITSGQLPATRFSSRIIRISISDLQSLGKSYESGEQGQWATR